MSLETRLDHATCVALQGGGTFPRVAKRQRQSSCTYLHNRWQRVLEAHTREATRECVQEATYSV